MSSTFCPRSRSKLSLRTAWSSVRSIPSSRPPAPARSVTARYSSPQSSRSCGFARANPARPRSDPRPGRLEFDLKSRRIIMSMLKDFRDFAVKGNVIDLAVAVIIGAAFGKIVDSLVKDVIMPVIGRIFGGLDFANYFIMLAPPPAGYSGPMTYDALTKAGVPLLAYGNFITVIINFLILAFIIFWMVRQLTSVKKKIDPASAVAPVPEDVLLLREIRDALKRQIAMLLRRWRMANSGDPGSA